MYQIVSRYLQRRIWELLDMRRWRHGYLIRMMPSSIASSVWLFVFSRAKKGSSEYKWSSGEGCQCQCPHEPRADTQASSDSWPQPHLARARLQESSGLLSWKTASVIHGRSLTRSPSLALTSRQCWGWPRSQRPGLPWAPASLHEPPSSTRPQSSDTKFSWPEPRRPVASCLHMSTLSAASGANEW